MTEDETALVRYMDEHNFEAVADWLAEHDSRGDKRPLSPLSTYAHGYLAWARERNAKVSLGHWRPLIDDSAVLPDQVRGRFLMSVGAIYAEREQFDRALYYLQQSHAIHTENEAEMDVAAVLINMMGLHIYMQAYSDILPLADQATTILTAQPHSKRQQIYLGAATNQHALACLELGQDEQAETLLHRCLTIQDGIDNVRGQAMAHDNLALIAERRGAWETAETHYHTALSHHQNANNLRGTVTSHYHLGLIALRERHDFAQARHNLTHGLDLAERLQYDEFITRLHLGLAELCEREGDDAGSLAQTEAAVHAAERLRANIVLPDDRAKMMSARISAYEQLVERLCRAEQVTEAFRVMEMCKSRVLVELLADKPLRRPQNVPAAWLDEEQALREQLQTLYQATHSNSDPTQIDQLETQLAQLREQIRIQDAEFGSFKTVDPLSLDAVQARLPDGAVMIAYFAAGSSLMAFTITPTTVTHTPLTLTLPQLKRAFTAVADDRLGTLHGLLPTAQAELQEPWMLRRLYDFLLAPLGDVVETAETLIIIPHDILHYVPFHALYRDEHVYVNTRNGEARPIIYAPSATVLLDYCQTKLPSTQTGCLALGYNDSQLTHAEKEAEMVVSAVGGMAYLGKGAVCERLMETGKQYRYIHLSCHGWFNPMWPLSSSLSLADGTLDVVDVLRDVALEAELVSLSACETGRHAILKGDELVGLTRAFLYAGTPAVLVSQWVVDEMSTRLLMTHFYEQIADGRTIPAALSTAQQHIRTLTIAQIRAKLPELTALSEMPEMDDEARPFAHPYYWASFFLSGGRF